MRAARVAALSLLAIVGASNALGSTLELAAPALPLGKTVASIGRASLASPAPRVFCKMGDIEPFAREHAIAITYADGATVARSVDDAGSLRLKGPYALRNVYGAAIVFAPMLPRRTTEAVVRHGVCDGAAFDPPLDHEGHGGAHTVVITSQPRAGGVGAPTRVEVSCAR